MVRILLAILASLSFLSLKAQKPIPVTQPISVSQPLPPTHLGYIPWTPYPTYTLPLSSLPSDRKWHLNSYTGLSAGTIFSRYGGASYVSVPFGLQLTRPLNNNFYAFTGISAAPTVFSANRFLADPGSKPYDLKLNARLEGGFIYVNDARTFSISGSVGVERGSYPAYQSNRENTRKP